MLPPLRPWYCNQDQIESRSQLEAATVFFDFYAVPKQSLTTWRIKKFHWGMYHTWGPTSIGMVYVCVVGSGIGTSAITCRKKMKYFPPVCSWETFEVQLFLPTRFSKTHPHNSHRLKTKWISYFSVLVPTSGFSWWKKHAHCKNVMLVHPFATYNSIHLQ